MSTLHVERGGHGPDLVLLHGWAMSSAVWGPFAEGLRRSWRVTSVDLPGHGQSRDCRFEPGRVAAQVAAAVPDGAVWLGWSLGGQVALRAAWEGAAEIRALVLLSSTPRFLSAEDWPYGLPAAELQALENRIDDGPEMAVRQFLGLLASRGEGARRAARTVRAALATAPAAPQALAAGLQWLADTDLRPALPEIGLPALWLAGGDDPLVGAAAAAFAAEAMPAGGVEVLPRAGHMPFLTHSGDCLSALERFGTILQP